MKTVQLIVECPMDEYFEKQISEFGTVKYRLPLINAFVIEIPEYKINNLREIKDMVAIYEAAEISAQMNSARKTINADGSLVRGLNGRGITIAILDTGVTSLDDFVKPRNRLVYFKDFLNGKRDAYDDNGHGTHVP